jgi:hypothetical protein
MFGRTKILVAEMRTVTEQPFQWRENTLEIACSQMHVTIIRTLSQISGKWDGREGKQKYKWIICSSDRFSW